MRTLRELKQGAWYEIRTAVNNRKPLFQSRKALRLFAKVLDDVSKRFDFEIRGLLLKDESLVFYIKPADGFKLPRIMQWLKQTFAVRYNLLKGWTGHIWGDRYWSRIAEGEPPEGSECRTEAVADEEAAELLLAGGMVRPLSRRMKARVRPLLGKSVKIPHKAAAPPPNPAQTCFPAAKRLKKPVYAIPPASTCGRNLPALSALARLDYKQTPAISSYKKV
jgi:REP element-mobilizing transposase RayT